MIILINGAFGVGKTSTAELLKTRLSNSMIYDPEEVGYMLRKIVVPNQLETVDDFQHLALWPSLVGEVARQVSQHYQRHLIVPMTFAFPDYFQKIKADFLTFEPELYHFCLMASAPTLRRRLEQRGDPPGSWPYQQIARCLEALASPQYEVHVDTEALNTQSIVDVILARIGLR